MILNIRLNITHEEYEKEFFGIILTAEREILCDFEDTRCRWEAAEMNYATAN